MEWLKGDPDLFRKYNWHINIDGVRYTVDEYDKMFQEASRLKEGDLVYNLQSGQDEPIMEIRRDWVQFWPAHYKGVEVFVEEITFVTESGCIVYDINDRLHCNAPSAA